MLWTSGGTEATPVPVGVMPAGAYGSGAVDDGSTVFLVGHDAAHGVELWAIDCGPVCPGDCDVDGDVRVDELVRAVEVALGLARVNVCAAADTDADLAVSVGELVAAVGHALDSCG